MHRKSSCTAKLILTTFLVISLTLLIVSLVLKFKIIPDIENHLNNHIQVVQYVWENTIVFDPTLLENDLAKLDIVRISKSLLFYSGTKWCGPGNIADNEYELGNHRDTDKCCRNHDFCDDLIEGWETAHNLNLSNPVFYSRVNCECDEEFYRCLKSINHPSAKQIGNFYFNMLGAYCFKEEYPIISCRKYSNMQLFLMKKCVDYELDTTKEKKYQWFDVPTF